MKHEHKHPLAAYIAESATSYGKIRCVISKTDKHHELKRALESET